MFKRIIKSFFLMVAVAVVGMLTALAAIIMAIMLYEMVTEYKNIMLPSLGLLGIWWACYHIVSIKDEKGE